ncbi:4-hydroxy-tetrahydrodipicolinate synthase [Breznakiella homolactica]|uniref:4-hydroxy-tetrahydrodipicolinate synthase n=1 Tax=Breznakiella homolactica TaxID=2798577 RepID=A0A7T7XLN9_9SPIR|nr:4-hydroxy-tetrahydrodipicolinate synthase [Breznakiella homolactica]QQO08512.1 4-hydroxy-tetrahydrodipicolinate synthase [Breznakiella homolactica]
MENHVRGIIPAVITPFLENGSINFEEYKTLLQFLVKAGVNAVFISGNAGEFYSLTFDEKARLIKEAQKSIGNTVPIIFGSGAVTTEETVALTKMAESEGADVITVITPYLIKPTEDELFAHFSAVCGATKLPVLLYNNPAITSVPISSALVKRLLCFDNLVGIKDSSGDFALTLDFMHLSKELQVFAGRDGLILATLLHGGAGAVSSIASACPELAVSIYRHFINNEMEKAVEAQHCLAKLRQCFNLGTFPSVVKEVLSMRGFSPGLPRKPVGPLPEEKRRILESTLRDIHVL